MCTFWFLTAYFIVFFFFHRFLLSLDPNMRGDSKTLFPGLATRLSVVSSTLFCAEKSGPALSDFFSKKGPGSQQILWPLIPGSDHHFLQWGQFQRGLEKGFSSSDNIGQCRPGRWWALGLLLNLAVYCARGNISLQGKTQWAPNFYQCQVLNT